MANTPPVDKITVVDKGFGKYGVPIDPTGGITMTPEGATLTPLLSAGFIEIPPDVVEGSTLVNYFSEETLSHIRTYYRKQGRLVDFLLIWRPDRLFLFRENEEKATGVLTFGLPEPIEILGELEKIGGNVGALNICTTAVMTETGVKNWGEVYPSVEPSSQFNQNSFNLLYHDGSNWGKVTADDPFHLSYNDSVYFNFQYISES